eukprot:TRINITY_DN13017_c0_g1_i1.p1 TRINITY_DN13017_c0_g1~~TRINITY_DN13017_c0_g1_i1.p1  ORF type:complete len:254 (+),score=22.59 TRINITY_DN13017_c0_g1_i1:344-1105(+)
MAGAVTACRSKSNGQPAPCSRGVSPDARAARPSCTRVGSPDGRATRPVKKAAKSAIFSNTTTRPSGWQKRARYHGKYVPFKDEKPKPNAHQHSHSFAAPVPATSPTRGRMSTVTQAAVQARLSKSPVPPGRRVQRLSVDVQSPPPPAYEEVPLQKPAEMVSPTKPEKQEIGTQVEIPMEAAADGPGATSYVTALANAQPAEGRYPFVAQLVASEAATSTTFLPPTVRLLSEAVTGRPGPHLALLFDVLLEKAR